MKTILSLVASNQLKEWGCEIASCYQWELFDLSHERINVVAAVSPKPSGISHLIKNNEHSNYYKDWEEEHPDDLDVFKMYNAYDLRDIICDKELSKSFFPRITTPEALNKNGRSFHPTIEILFALQQGDMKEAEKIFLEDTIFNPNNK